MDSGFVVPGLDKKVSYLQIGLAVAIVYLLGIRLGAGSALVGGQGMGAQAVDIALIALILAYVLPTIRDAVGI